MSGQARLLYIHASVDEGLRRALEKHLTSLVREGLIESWHAGLLSAGAHVNQQLEQEVRQADVVLLLLSADFVASDRCQALLAQVEREATARQVTVVPILARPVDWRGTGQTERQALPRNGQAVSLWTSQDAAWVEIAQALREVLVAGPERARTRPGQRAAPSPIAGTRGPSMSNADKPSVNTTIHIGGSVIGGAIVAGDGNRLEVRYQGATLPPPDSVDLRAELVAIRQVLAALQCSDQRRIDRALDEAHEEAEQPTPRNEVIGESLEKALTIATQAGAFAEAAAKLQPHVVNVTAWLGAAWHKLLPIVGSIV